MNMIITKAYSIHEIQKKWLPVNNLQSFFILVLLYRVEEELFKFQDLWLQVSILDIIHAL